MSKRLTRVLSLILTLVMFLSVSTTAFALGGGELGDGWDRDIGEDEILTPDPAEEPEEEYDEDPNDYFSSFDETGLTVTVEAPMGALPTLAEVRAERVEAETVQDVVDAVSGTNRNIVLAVDISFWFNGQEIEPDMPVRVKIAAPELEDQDNLALIHIPDADEAETVDLLDDEQMEFDLGTNEIAFEADSFSVYVIVNNEDDPPVNVTYRRTYKFTTDGTEPFQFYNKAGKLVSEQIVKNNDELEAVTLPYSAGHSFQNWVVFASDDEAVPVGTEIDLPIEKVTGITKDTTVTLMPAYGKVFYVTFHSADAPADPDVILTKKIVVDGEKVVIGDVLAPSPDESHIFFGWTPDPDGSATNAVPVYDSNNQLDKTKEYPTAITANLDLYPFFEEAFWLRFVSGETGSRASYVPAQFARADQTLTKLPVPTRVGYTFAGWYTGSQDDEGKITYDAQVTDGQGNVTNPASGLKLTAETVLYGKWTANNDSSYKVVIWRQKVTDDKDAADSAKTYDYAESEIRTGTTDDPVAPSSADMSKSGGDYTGFHYARTVQNSETIRADGSTVVNVYYDRDLIAFNFYYRNTHAPEGAETAYTYTATTSNDGTQYGVKPDGTYVQLTRGEDSPTTRVYYTFYGYEYTGTFYTLRGNNNYVASEYSGSNLPPEGDTTTYYAYSYYRYYALTRQTETIHNYGWSYQDGGQTVVYTDTRYTRSPMSTYTNMVTYTGLWGQNFDKYGYTWPSEYEWNESQNGNGTIQTFLTGFVQKDNDGNVMNPYNLYDQNEPGSSTIYHYKQGLDGKWHEDDRSTAKSSGGTFTFSNKFEGFTVATYGSSFNQNGGNTSAIGSDGKPKTGVRLSNPAHIYHTRNQWTITYQATESAQSTQFMTVKTSEKIYYEAPLGTKAENGTVTSAYDLTQAQAGLADRPGYTFSGWYADETCTQKFDFSGLMPNANVTVYAGWEPVWYQILIDPDGGIITPDIGSTYMWKAYGTEEKLSRYEVVRPYIEDPNGSFGYVYVDGRDDPDGNIKVRTATYEPWKEGMGTKYRAIGADDPSYTLVGWYDVDFETGETTDNPHDFDAEITGPIWIRAVWNLGGDYGFVYNATALVKTTVNDTEVEVAVSGSFTQAEPDARYADGAEVVVDAPPTSISPMGFVFDGWEIVEPNVGEEQGAVLDNNGGNYYQPGEKLTLNAAAWARTGRNVYLRAHYSPVESSDEPIGVTYLQFDPNFPTDVAEAARTGEATEVMYFPMNSAIDLENDDFVPNDYAAGGYKLIGWSQNKDADPVVNHDAALGQIVFGRKDIVGVDGLAPTVQHMEYIAGYDEDDNPIKKDVTGNILYAIWAPEYFFIFHSSSGDLQAVRMPSTESGTVDLTTLVASNNLYGGYFKAYLGNENFATTANKEAALKASGLKVNITNKTYDGSALFIRENNKAVIFWSKAKAYTEVPGTSLKPTVDTVYYLREIPQAFLGVRIQAVYDWSNDFLIDDLYFITTVDNNMYEEAGFKVVQDNKAKFYASYSIQSRNSDSATVIKAIDINKIGGYVGAWIGTQVLTDTPENGTFTVQAYYITLDKVRVEDTYHGARTFNVGLKTVHAEPQDTDFHEVKP